LKVFALSEIGTSLTGFRQLFVVVSQLVGGFATGILLLYAFFLWFAGPQFLLGYYSVALPGLFSEGAFAAGFLIVFGISPFLAVGFQIARHKYSTREWMRSTRSAFFLGLLLGVSAVALYITLLLLSLADPQKFGPGAGGGVGA